MSTPAAPAPAAAPARGAPLGPAQLGLAGAALLCAAAVTTGAAFLKGASELQPLMVATGVAALAAAAAGTLRAERDWFNPLLLLIATWTLRVGVPALYLQFAEPPPELASVMHIARSQWALGFALGLVGIAAIALGWMLLPRATARLGRTFAYALERSFRIDFRTFLVGLLFVGLGLGAIIIFLRLNYSSSSDAITSGVIRKGGSRVGGTSRYSFLATALTTYGALAASTYLLRVRRTPWPLGFLPALAATLVMSIFGGRVLAITPLAYAALVFWYRSDRRHIGPARVALPALAGAVAFGLYSIFIAYYRSGFGLKAASVALSLNGIGRYLSNTLWYEAGMLHPYTVATAFPPGVLKGASLPLTLGYVGSLAGIDGVRPGQFMVEAIVGRVRERAWGWHSGIIIDLYMNYGLFATVLGGILFGMLLRTVYSGFRARPGPVATAFYAMLLWHFFWMYWEHTAAAMNIVFIQFPFTLLILLAAPLLPARLRAGAGGLRRAAPEAA